MRSIKETMKYLEVILPLPVGSTFTYTLDTEQSEEALVGRRVVVPFGPSKIYAGVVRSVSDNKPKGDYELKSVIDILDAHAIVSREQLALWAWIADYYMCSLGEVMKAALPAGLKLESETTVRLNTEFGEWDSLSPVENEVISLLQDGKSHSVASLQKNIGVNRVLRVMRSLIEKGAVEAGERLASSFRPKKEAHVRLNNKYLSESALNALFESLNKTPRRYQLVLKLVELADIPLSLKLKNPRLVREVSKAALLKESAASAAVLAGLKAKGVVEIYDYEVGRLNNKDAATIMEQLPLSPAQQRAYDEILSCLKQKNVCLLHGVTSSGKTEIYIRLIRQALSEGKQVLYLLPEIALTTQITDRLRRVFGNRLGVYHSKFPDNERVEIWLKQAGKNPYDVLLGVRSSLLLPHPKLGLVIVDEEHEPSYKQQDPAPRYNARDTAIVMARRYGAKVLLGTATPSVETYHNATTGKYGYVRLTERFGQVMLPQVRVVDIQDLMRRKLMHFPFSPDLENEIRQALAHKEQVILFLNRRGYAPVVECTTCGWVPRCQYCDVSLTYHLDDHRLHCHYCGNSYPVPTECPNCHSHELRSFGLGTEKVEEEVHRRFPAARTARLDLDTTRSRLSYQRILGDFSRGRTDILIGTQMVSKGLDFGNVRVVGIVDADKIINRPDFRAHERAFQMMMQVAGRAGRRDTKGTVILQTRRADNLVIRQVVESDYEGMYKNELDERRKYFYPPFYRLIYVWFKHKDERVAQEGAQRMSVLMQEHFRGGVLGPDKPEVSRISMFHLRRAALKVSPALSTHSVRMALLSIADKVHAIPHLHSLHIYFDVDPL